MLSFTNLGRFLVEPLALDDEFDPASSPALLLFCLVIVQLRRRCGLMCVSVCVCGGVTLTTARLILFLGQLPIALSVE
jgi:hypothetical protein